MFCSAWLFSLFGMLIPLENQVYFKFLQKIDFYDKLAVSGWNFFYKLVMAYMENKEEELF